MTFEETLKKLVSIAQSLADDDARVGVLDQIFAQVYALQAEMAPDMLGYSALFKAVRNSPWFLDMTRRDASAMATPKSAAAAILRDTEQRHPRAQKAPRTGEIIQDVKDLLADVDGVAAFVAINTGIVGGWEILLPGGGVAKWEAEGVSFDFSGKTPQQIEQGLTQLGNLLNRASQGLGALRGLCGAYQSAAKAYAKDRPVMLAGSLDLAAMTARHTAKGTN